ncbi:MAG: PKD domain-containing protein, partial [Bacteroidetes bacterium]
NAYLNSSCGSNQLYVEAWPNNNVSEGLGYGMIITAYMAGYDPNAQNLFDKLYNFYKAHPSNINPKLMAWNQDNCTSVNGVDSASDGDIDIAYGLLLAHAQWGSAGAIDYLTEAENIINAIMADDVNHETWSVKLGDWSSPGSYYYYSTRPSDFIIDHFRAFECAVSDPNWTNVINTCYNLVDIMQTNHSPVAKLIPDFIKNVNTTPVPANANFLEGPYDGDYYYNSCRVPWRLGTDYLLSGDTRAKDALDAMTNWLKSTTNNNVNNLSNGYLLNGTAIYSWNDPAYLAPWAVAAMTGSAHQTWLNDLYNSVKNTSFSSMGYYENSIKMICMIVLSGNYWSPTCTPPPPPPTAAFTATPTSGFAPLTVSFDATASSDPNGSTLTYAWDFGDGNSGNGVTVNHTYTTFGTFTATLTVTNNNGASDTETATITVQNPNPIPPTISITAPTDGSVHSLGNIALEADASDTDGNVVSVDFSVDGNTLSASNTSGNLWTTNWNADTPGTYTITATATDNEGLTSNASVVITVEAPPCTNVTNHWISNLGSTSAVVNWDAIYGAKKYKVRYRELGGSWTPITVNASQTNVLLTGLSAETTYQYQIKVKCPSGWTTWNTKTNFTTPANDVFGTFTVTSDWGTGYCAEITLTNNGTSAINGWTLDFDLIASITSLWNGTWSSNGSNNYTVNDAGWNANIPAGGSVTFGFCADYSGTLMPPYNAFLNGMSIDINSSLPIPPTIAITAPNNGDSFPENSVITLTADASDPNGTVSSVDFDVNGTIYPAVNVSGNTWEATYTAATPGNDIITAIATDNDGNTASDVISITITSSGGSSVSGHFHVTSNWGTGYCANVTITNNGSSAINGWTLIFDLNANITSLWNGTWTNNGSNNYTVNDAGWNANIPAGGSRTFGFCASYSGTITPPTNATLNGMPISFTATYNMIGNPGQTNQAVPHYLSENLTIQPNITNDETTIRYTLNEDSQVRLVLLNST